MQEFIEDNLSTGAICQPDKVVGTECNQPQTFMQLSMMYEFFCRVYSNYGDLNNGLFKAIVGIPKTLYEHGTEKNSEIIFNGNHAALLGCSTNTGRTALASCNYDNVPGDGR